MTTLFSAKEITTLTKKISPPFYLYDQKQFLKNIKTIKKFNHPYGLTVRYALKANPNFHLTKILNEQGIHFDASSIYEAKRLVLAGIQPEKIMLTAQEIPEDILEIDQLGIQYNACSLRQLELYGVFGKKKKISVRINPGKGSGGNNRTNVGGKTASFGIWHEYIPTVLKIAKEYNLVIDKLHTHIGSGSDPKIWQQVCKMTINLLKHFPKVKTVNLGGGFKVARYQGEKTTDLAIVSNKIKQQLIDFYQKTGRKIHLEIEPGTYFVANMGNLVAKVNDLVDTGKEGYRFIKLNTGLNDFLRVSLYGARHRLQHIALTTKNKQEKLKIIDNTSNSDSNSSSTKNQEYIVVGHCCESGDIFTTLSGNPEQLEARILGSENFQTNLTSTKKAKVKVGDLILVQDVGAYGSAMSVKNYNSFPESAEYLKIKTNDFLCIHPRQTLKELM